MNRAIKAATAVAAGTALALGGISAAQAVDTELGDEVVEGDLVIPAGEDWVLGGTTIEGDLIVGEDAWVDATDIVVTGDVIATDSYGVSIDGASVGGDVSSASLDLRAGFLYVFDLEVGGSVDATGVDLEVYDSSIAGELYADGANYVDLVRSGVTGDVWVSGADFGVRFAGATIGGSATIDGSSRDLLVSSNATGERDPLGSIVQGDLVLSGNTGNLRVAGTTVHGELRASGNTPVAQIGEGVLAGSVSGDVEGSAVGEASQGDQSIAVVVPEPDAGEFSWSIESTSRLVDLGQAEELQDRFRADGSIQPVRVQDTRAGDPAWSLSAVVSDFTAGGEPVSSEYLGWTPGIIEQGGGVLAGAAIVSGFERGDGLSVSRTLAGAADGHERGDAVVGAELLLDLPLDTPTGNYSASLTFTALG